MKKMRLLTIIPLCCMLMLSPVSALKAGAVTVDINDNYDAGLLNEERGGGGGGSEESSSAASSTVQPGQTTGVNANTANTPGGATGTGNNTAVTPATTDTAATTAASVTETTAETTNDLPRTGDDNRIMITFIAMLGSLCVFLTALLSGRHIGENA